MITSKAKIAREKRDDARALHGDSEHVARGKPARVIEAHIPHGLGAAVREALAVGQRLGDLGPVGVVGKGRRVGPRVVEDVAVGCHKGGAQLAQLERRQDLLVVVGLIKQGAERRALTGELLVLVGKERALEQDGRRRRHDDGDGGAGCDDGEEDLPGERKLPRSALICR